MSLAPFGTHHSVNIAFRTIFWSFGTSRCPFRSHLPGGYGQKRRSRSIPLCFRLALLEMWSGNHRQVGCTPLVSSRLCFPRQETRLHFCRVFYPAFGMFVFTTNHITYTFYSLFRISGTTHRTPRFSGYLSGNFSLGGGRVTHGHPPLLSIGINRLVAPGGTQHPQIPHIFMHIGRVFRSPRSISTNSLSIVSAFSSHSQGWFLPVPGWYTRLMHGPIIACPLVQGSVDCSNCCVSSAPQDCLGTSVAPIIVWVTLVCL